MRLPTRQRRQAQGAEQRKCSVRCSKAELDVMSPPLLKQTQERPLPGTRLEGGRSGRPQAASATPSSLSIPAKLASPRVTLHSPPVSQGASQRSDSQMLEFLSRRQIREQGTGGLAVMGQVASSLSPGDSRLGRGDNPPGTCSCQGPVCECGHPPFRVGTHTLSHAPWAPPHSGHHVSSSDPASLTATAVLTRTWPCPLTA